MPVPTRDALSPERLNAINRLTVVARLLSSAVHDARNSMQIITGHAELFAESAADPDKARERSRSILTHADRATQRLQGLVAMGQEAEAAPGRFEMRALAEEVFGLRKSSFGRARIKVTVEPATGEFWVKAVRPSIQRAAANLMLNAERAVAGRPGAEIQFRVSEQGGRVRLIVRDNGPGVEADRVQGLFEPFAPGNGPGIGLHVSRWLVERTGGTLSLGANSESGAEFVIELPADR